MPLPNSVYFGIVLDFGFGFDFGARWLHLKTHHCFSIFLGADEDVISIALGLTCHLVTMLAHYLCVPLRYPLIPMGSRASVLDPVSLLVGPKE